MKRKAFIQAVLILLLLGVSWIALFTKLKRENVPGDTVPPLEEFQSPVVDPSNIEVEGELLPETPFRTDNRELVPDIWLDWWDYLSGQGSPEDMQTALAALRDLIGEMPPERASDWLMEFINSAADLRTGLAFQVQGDGRLRAANSLRAYLLDLLQMVDPDLAGSLAEQELVDRGTLLVPDVYVIHMRNFAKWPELDDNQAMPFLQDKFQQMIQHKPWTDNPTTAIAEAMDVAVYTRGVQFVPALSEMMQQGQPQMLRHASALAMERLVDRMPLETLGMLLDELPRQSGSNNARAGYFARMDPGSPGAGELFTAYLTSPALNTGEAVRFLESFPNLNQSYSNNLLSTHFSNTEPGEYVDWYERALVRIQEWQQDDKLLHLQDILTDTEDRLRTQLTGEPFL